MTIEQAWEILAANDRGEWVDCYDINEAYRVIASQRTS